MLFLDDNLINVEGARSADPKAVAPALAPERMTRGRTALVRVVPLDDIPPLPDLARLWEQVADDSDAFVIRLVLVPALMHLFGKASWWMPAALERRLPRLSIEGPAESTPERESVPA